MNIVKQLEALGLSGWTWRGVQEVDRPVCCVLRDGSTQPQSEADLSVLNLIEWQGDKPELTWEMLESAKPKKSDYEQAIAEGFTIPNTNIVMSVSPKSVTTLNNYATHLDRKFQAGDIDANTLVEIVDKDDGKHKISYQDFVDMLIPLGDRALVVDFIGRSAGVV
jgi:hypothetical protein